MLEFVPRFGGAFCEVNKFTDINFCRLITLRWTIAIAVKQIKIKRVLSVLGQIPERNPK
jgi:hypothetical protein